MAAREVKLKIESVDQAVHEAPVVFVDGAQGILASAGIVKINLFQDRLLAGPQATKPVERVTTVRLVMTPDTMVSLAEWLTDRVADMNVAAAERTGEPLEPTAKEEKS